MSSKKKTAKNAEGIPYIPPDIHNEPEHVEKVLALKPGLHVRRYRALPDGVNVYTVVRVISTDRGNGPVFSIVTLNNIDGEDELELTQFEIESSYFMEIKE